MKKGSSLVEALCAILILTFGIMGSISSILASIQNFTASRVNDIATRINQTIASDLELVDFDRLELRVGTLPEDYVYTFEGKNIGNLGEEVSGNDTPFFTISNVNTLQLTDDLYQITTTITWLSQETDRSRGLGYEADGLAYQHTFLVSRNEVN